MWVGQEPSWDSPINRGSHCAKGAATRELVHGDRRLRYPMKLVDGQWTRISWDVAIKRDRRQAVADPRKNGATPSTGWARRSSPTKFLPEPQACGILGHQQLRPPGPYLSLHHRRRRRQYLGLRRDDQQLTDIRNSKTMIIMGGNPAEAHPVSLRMCWKARRCSAPHDRDRSAHDPHRRACHRICAHPLRYGFPVIYGMLWHIFKNGWKTSSSSNSAFTAWTSSARRSRSIRLTWSSRFSGVPGAQLERGRQDVRGRKSPRR